MAGHASGESIVTTPFARSSFVGVRSVGAINRLRAHE
jgi:hypothetical protein